VSELPRAVLRRVGHRYLVEAYGAGATDRKLYHSLVVALNAEPALRLRWRPVTPAEQESARYGPDALYVVPA
jgi:hypothetical protein